MVKQFILNTTRLNPHDAAQVIMSECVSRGATPEQAARMMNIGDDEGAEIWASIEDSLGENSDD